MVTWLTFGLNILILIVSIAGFLKIMKNDLCHLQKGQEEMKKSVDHIYSKVNGLCQRVSRIEGKLEK
jgi:uncharacterized protein YoxC